jgi:hypothetical protein
LVHGVAARAAVLVFALVAVVDSSSAFSVRLVLLTTCPTHTNWFCDAACTAVKTRCMHSSKGVNAGSIGRRFFSSFCVDRTSFQRVSWPFRPSRGHAGWRCCAVCTAQKASNTPLRYCVEGVFSRAVRAYRPWEFRRRSRRSSGCERHASVGTLAFSLSRHHPRRQPLASGSHYGPPVLPPICSKSRRYFVRGRRARRRSRLCKTANETQGLTRRRRTLRRRTLRRLPRASPSAHLAPHRDIR